MTAKEVRAAVLAHQRLERILDQEELPDDLHSRLDAHRTSIWSALYDVTGNSAPSRWARSMVGPVLAAGLGATIFMRKDVPNEGAALRIFGLAGERSLSASAAWKLMQPYIWEPVVSAQVLAHLRMRTGLRLQKLPRDPAPLDVLVELTRPRNNAFAVQMTAWLTEYFRQHPDAGTPYAALYRATLAGLITHNLNGEMAQFTGPAQLHGHPSREEWEQLLHNRLPQARVEARAAFLVTKQFILDYWAQWQQPAVRLAAG